MGKRIAWSMITILGLAILASPAAVAQQESNGVHEICRYSLTLFKIDDATLGVHNERLLREEIVPDIYPSSRVTVIGYTDVIGLEDRNQRLSEQRAEAVAKRIMAEKGPNGYKELIARGVGESAPLYSNDLPEGRFYNRTVQIEIDTRR